MSQLTELHIAVGFDDNYYNPFCALAASIITNTGAAIHFHIIAPTLSPDKRSTIIKYVSSSGNKIDFYEINQLLANQFVVTGKWTTAVYYRLFFPILLANKVKRLVYLDTDIIVNQSLLPLFEIDLNSKPVAAVYDNYVKIQPLIGIEEEGNYFNSGVLLIDINEWNRQQISQKTFHYLQNFPENIRFVDQCALNAVLKNNWLKLPNRYNFLFSYLPFEISKKELKLLIKDITIIHYTLSRPWEMLCRNRLRFLYLKFLSLSPGRNNGPAVKDFSLAKLPTLFKIRIREIYFDLEVFKKVYRKIKGQRSKQS